MAEVQVQLQKALAALSRLDDPQFRKSARKHSVIALDRVRNAPGLGVDVERAEEAAARIL